MSDLRVGSLEEREYLSDQLDFVRSQLNLLIQDIKKRIQAVSEEVKDKVNVRITAVVSPDQHFLKQLSFTWFSINHVLVSNLIIRWSLEERLFLSGGMIFISSHLILLRRVIGDIERPLYICSTVIKISLIYERQNLIIEISASAANCMFLLSLGLNKIELFSFIFSIYQNIWAIKAWWIKYD